MSSLTELQTIPGVGATLSQSLLDLGYTKVEDLKDQDPEQIYLDMVGSHARQVDRCVLYVLRGAVYFASNTVYDPELLKWWNWKDESPYPLRSNPKLLGAGHVQ